MQTNHKFPIDLMFELNCGFHTERVLKELRQKNNLGI